MELEKIEKDEGDEAAVELGSLCGAGGASHPPSLALISNQRTQRLTLARI